MSGSQCPSKAPTASNVSTSVIEAARTGDVATLKSILEKGENPNARDSKGVPALHLAAAGGHVQTVGALLEGGARVDVDGPGIVTALHVAVANGHVDVVRRLLDKAADYTKRDAQGNTPLMLAVKEKHWVVICLFVERGAIGTDDEWISALTVAAAEGEVESVLLICRYLENKENLLRVAVLQALSSVKNAAVLWAFDDVLPGIIKEECNKALLVAALNGRHEAVEVLLDAGAAINHGDGLGRTSLMFASEYGHTECVRKLLQRGARIDAFDGYRKTALHWAAKNGREDVVRALLGGGADTTLKNYVGETALDVAKSEAVKNIIETAHASTLKAEFEKF